MMLKKILQISKKSPRTAMQLIRAVDDFSGPELDAPNPTGEFAASPEVINQYLGRLLSHEYLAWTTYTMYAGLANGIMRQPIADLFLEHAEEELKHIQSILLWVTTLRAFDFVPWRLTCTIPQVTDLEGMIAIVHVQESMAISLYREGLTLAGTKEGFRQLLETILEQEQEHANEMSVLLVGAGA